MSKSVLLINPPSAWAEEAAMHPPLGLSFLASYLAGHGVRDVHGFDMSIGQPDKRITRIPDGFDYYVVGAMTPQFEWAEKVCRRVRAKNPRAKIVVGGPHFSSIPEDKPAAADVVIRGEGERALHEYIMTGKVDENAVHRMEEKDLTRMPDREAFRFRENLRDGNYRRTLEGQPAAHMVTLRGCPFACSFCDRFSVGRTVRYRPVWHVIREVQWLKAYYGINHLVIYDDIFTLKKDRVEELCEAFKRMGIRWRCWSRADTTSYDQLALMKDSGLVSITMGIESGDDEILKTVDKKITAEANREALLWCKDLSIPVRCSLMYGNPGECRRSVDNTIKLVEETQPDEWNLAVLTPIPGSPIWDDPARYGLRIDKAAMRRRKYSGLDRFGDSGIGNIGYEFIHMGMEEMRGNLNHFVTELERVCPRKIIQDTIQNIDVSKVGAVI